MLHPSYSDLMNVVNEGADEKEPMVNSRYSIVIATSKRARQLIDEKATEEGSDYFKPLSVAINELQNGEVKILGEDESADPMLIEEMAENEE